MRGFGGLLTKYYLSKVVQRGTMKRGGNPHNCYRGTVIVHKFFSEMKQVRNKTFIILILVFGSVINLHAENYSQADTSGVTKIVFDFFDWYISSINSHNSSEYSPQFVESETGMTTLDFSKYFDNLERLNFSESLLEREKQFFQDCVDNLAKVKYSEFLVEFDDLDDFEATNCDFNNRYKWIGGQESVDSFKVGKVYFENESVIVEVEYFDNNSVGSEYYERGNNKVTLTKIKNHWKINGFDWR